MTFSTILRKTVRVFDKNSAYLLIYYENKMFILFHLFLYSLINTNVKSQIKMPLIGEEVKLIERI